jgi:hypothetical protein
MMLRRLGVETEPPRSPRSTNISRRRVSCSSVLSQYLSGIQSFDSGFLPLPSRDRRRAIVEQVGSPHSPKLPGSPERPRCWFGAWSVPRRKATLGLV